MKKWMKIALSAFLAVFLGLLVSGIINGMRYGKPQPIVSEAGLPQHVEFTKKACEPCDEMKTVLDTVIADTAGKLDVRYIDVEDEANRAIVFFHRIRSVPAQLFLDKDGNVLWRHDGKLTKQEVLEKWANLGYDFATK